MAEVKLSKVYFNKSSSTIDFATDEYLIDSLKLFSAESHLPINQLLMILHKKQADTVSCSRDDTNYSFFARRHKDKISVALKKLGRETIEFEFPRKKLSEVTPK